MSQEERSPSTASMQCRRTQHKKLAHCSASCTQFTPIRQHLPFVPSTKAVTGAAMPACVASASRAVTAPRAAGLRSAHPAGMAAETCPASCAVPYPTLIPYRLRLCSCRALPRPAVAGHLFAAAGHGAEQLQVQPHLGAAAGPGPCCTFPLCSSSPACASALPSSFSLGPCGHLHVCLLATTSCAPCTPPAGQKPPLPGH